MDDRPSGSPRGVCAVTGASGYVGSRLASHLASTGWQVKALVRSGSSLRDEPPAVVPFELAAGPARGTFDGVDALVHAAYDFGQTRWKDVVRVNVDGSRRLLQAAREANVRRIVFVSTVAAFPGARSMYGRAKLEVERMALDAGAVVVRPGLVWGPQGAAMFGALRRAIERLPIVPLPAPPELPLTVVYEDDLALFLGRLLEDWPDPGERLFVAAAEQVLTFGELLRSLSADKDAGPRFLAVPWLPVWRALQVLEAFGFKPPFPSDRLLSLVTTDREPLTRASGASERYGVTFRPYSFS
jgi:nucleoside-diphosphate-sugar epimerase